MNFIERIEELKQEYFSLLNKNIDNEKKIKNLIEDNNKKEEKIRILQEKIGKYEAIEPYTTEEEEKHFEGVYCVNCGRPAHHYHHIVPRSLGGNNIQSNLAPLCEFCHGKIHGISYKSGGL